MHPSFRLLLTAVLVHGLCAAEPAADLPRSTPERQGIPSSAILDFIEAVDRDVDQMHSFMLVRHGHVVAEGWWGPYDARTPHMFYSLSKSFTSTAVGLAVAEGKLGLDDTVAQHLPDDLPAEPSANLKAMRVRDLLSMAAGHEQEPSFWKGGPLTTTWTRHFLAHPVPHQPGTRFLYNTPATFMCSALVQKATGQTVLDYLTPRLYEPLGFEDPYFMANPEGITIGGYGMMGRTGEIACFGQLLLQKGMWQGRQLIPAAWIAQATAKQVANGDNPTSDWAQGYGFQFWRCRHGAYRGDGAFGQYCVVLPEQDAVIAITGGLGDMQKPLSLIWDRLLPAMQAGTLPADDATRSRLTAKLAGLTVRLAAGQPTAPRATQVTGKQYLFPDNDRGIAALSFDFHAQPPVLTVRTAAGESRLTVGLGVWGPVAAAFSNGVDKLLSVPPRPLVAASGAWSSADTFAVKLVCPQTPYHSLLTFRFDGDRLVFSSAHNVSFGPREQPTLIGTMVPVR